MIPYNDTDVINCYISIVLYDQMSVGIIALKLKGQWTSGCQEQILISQKKSSFYLAVFFLTNPQNCSLYFKTLYESTMLHPDMCDPILLKFATENVRSNFLADEKLLLILLHMLLHSKFCPFEKNNIFYCYIKNCHVKDIMHVVH